MQSKQQSNNNKIKVNMNKIEKKRNKIKPMIVLEKSIKTYASSQT